MPPRGAILSPDHIIASLSILSANDVIHECGAPALSILSTDPDACIQLGYQKLHDVPYKEVKSCWLRYYTDASIHKAMRLMLAEDMDSGVHEESSLNKVVRCLDMALILAGGKGREDLIEKILDALEEEHELALRKATVENEDGERPAKRHKTEPSFLEVTTHGLTNQSTFPTPQPENIHLRMPISRKSGLDLEEFQNHVGSADTQLPLIITDAVSHWPAIERNGSRAWNKPAYLLKRTIGGRRLVPVELGRSYTDEDWGQKIMSFGEYMREYMLKDNHSERRTAEQQSHKQQEIEGNQDQEQEVATRIAYLAQHDLLSQIPALRSDLSIPDYCYSSPAEVTSFNGTAPLPPGLPEPLLNAWFGPAGTVSPLHTDPYHNILVQVVGYKYLRIYGPTETAALHPRGKTEAGVDMSNTASVDLDEAFEVFPEMDPFREASEDGCLGKGRSSASEIEGEKRRVFEEHYPGFSDATYQEAILGPGECLYLPPYWWHYVRSLTPSFSVSFWFN